MNLLSVRKTYIIIHQLSRYDLQRELSYGEPVVLHNHNFMFFNPTLNLLYSVGRRLSQIIIFIRDTFSPKSLLCR
jgi:hypothetical protein